MKTRRVMCVAFVAAILQVAGAADKSAVSPSVGPGCVYNFTQHRGETVEVPVFRFYFDGETSPRLTVRPKDFGNVSALPKPLADAFCAVDHNRPFASCARSCRWNTARAAASPVPSSCVVTPPQTAGGT